MRSTFLKLNSRDFWHGLVMAVLAALVATLAQWFNIEPFDYANFRFDILAEVAGTAALAYLTKNLLSTSDGAFMGIGR